MSEEFTCPACARKKERGDTEKKALLNRLSRIEGQVRGLKRMIEENAYCPDVLTQSAAASPLYSSDILTSIYCPESAFAKPPSTSRRVAILV